MPPEERADSLDDHVPTDAAQPLLQHGRDPERLDDAMNAAVEQPSSRDAALAIHPVLVPEAVRRLVDEKDAAARGQGGP